MMCGGKFETETHIASIYKKKSLEPPSFVSTVYPTYVYEYNSENRIYGRGIIVYILYVEGL
jgi:hypothetical protein